MKAYILIKSTGGNEREILDSIREMNGVKEASGTYGSYDIVTKVETADVAGLVVDKIRKLKGVVDTNTLIVAL